MNQQELKDHQRLLSQAADARLLHMNEQVLFPLLQKKVEQHLATICEQFKATGVAPLGSVAYVAVVRDLMQELEYKARHGDHATNKLNKMSETNKE